MIFRRSISGDLERNGKNPGERQDRINLYMRFAGVLGTGANVSCWPPPLDGLGGVYCENSDIAPVASGDGEAVRPDERLTPPGTNSYGVMAYSVDPESASRLWDLSTRLTATK
jgi:hypothetical protein